MKKSSRSGNRKYMKNRILFYFNRTEWKTKTFAQLNSRGFQSGATILIKVWMNEQFDVAIFFDHFFFCKIEPSLWYSRCKITVGIVIDAWWTNIFHTTQRKMRNMWMDAIKWIVDTVLPYIKACTLPQFCVLPEIGEHLVGWKEAI